MTRSLVSAGTAVASVLAMLFLWQATVAVFGISPDKLPAPSIILATIWRQRATFAAATGTTLEEALLGLVAGTVIGVGSGILLWRFRLLQLMFLPYLVAAQAVPIIAFGAIIIMWFGNGVSSKVAIAVYLSFFPVVVNTLLGIRSVDPGEISLLRSFGAQPRVILFKLQLPAALPSIFTAVRVGASLALVGAIVGEWFGATRGLGVILLAAMFDYQVPQLWAGILLTGLAGTALYAGVVLLQRSVAWWQVEA